MGFHTVLRGKIISIISGLHCPASSFPEKELGCAWGLMTSGQSSECLWPAGGPADPLRVGREGLPSLAHCHLAFLPDRTERVPEDSGRLLCSPGSPGPGRGWSWSELSGYCGRVRQVRGVPAWKVREVEKGPWVASTGWARIAQ